MNPMGQMQNGALPAMNDDMIAADFLVSAKTAVRNSAYALTEASTPEVRQAIQQQLNDAIHMHEQVFRYMEGKGLYNPKDFSKQIQVDLQAANQVMQQQ
ncbi:spore coat protein [Desmospora profundinema]|uniref:Spore coat protein n=1 Tax=Desmospora profundinema TaxID=1571184 RepID=A0ABU1IJC3_9BACL|nr:spore coat protein [Desmospora profundinema]MDR6224881.1 hypothetical protein [Desmospora profundinema]